MIDLGNSNVELLKAFYKSLPFSNKAQINRAEQMLINALETDASTGNELAGKMAAYLGEPIPRNTGNMRGFLASLIIGGLSDLAAGIFTGKKTNKAEAKKQDEARQLAEEAEYESKSLALQSEYEIQLAKKMKEEEDLAQLAKNEQSTAAVKKYIFAGIGIVVLITVGIVVFKKMN
jgi:predicted GIY-YIG superfamily endonuclease